MISTRTWHPGLTASAVVALASIVMLAITDLSPTVRMSRAPSARSLVARRGDSGADPTPVAAAAFSDLRMPIETADGTVTSLAATNGRVRIASLFYTHCPRMCPLTIATLQSIERTLTGAERARLAVVLLSLDPARDSPAQLAALRSERGLDGARWLLGRTAPQSVPQLSAAFATRITRSAAGGIDHTPALLLLDEHGAVLARTTNVTDIDPVFAVALRAALGAQRS